MKEYKILYIPYKQEELYIEFVKAEDIDEARKVFVKEYPKGKIEEIAELVKNIPT